MGFARWWIGVVLAVIAAFVSNLGLNLQKLSHLRQRRAISQSLNQSIDEANHRSNQYIKHTRSPSSPTNFSADSIHLNNLPYKPSLSPPVDPYLEHISSTSPLLNHPGHNHIDQPIRIAYQSFDQPGLPLAQPFSRSISHSTNRSTASSVLSSPGNDFHATDHSTCYSCSPSDQSMYQSINQSLRPYFHEPLWQVGLSLTFFGSLLDFLALIFAGTTVIAPLASLTLVSNTFLAHCMIGERVRLMDCLITLLIVFGSSLSVACADHEDHVIVRLIDLFDLFLQPRFLVYSVIVVCTMMALYLNIAHCEHMQSIHQTDTQSSLNTNTALQKSHRFSYAALSGLIGGQSVLFAKVTGQMLVKSLTSQSSANVSSDNFLLYPTSYVVLLLLGLSVTAQLHWLNEGLKHFTSLYIVPTFQAFWMISSILTGMVFFQEYRGVFDGISALGFPLGVCITITGVYLLSQKEDEDQSINHSVVSTDHRSAKPRSRSFDTFLSMRPHGDITSFPSASSSSFLALPTCNQSIHHTCVQPVTVQSMRSDQQASELSSSMPNQSNRMYDYDEQKL